MKKIAIVAAIGAIISYFVYLQFKESTPADPRGDLYAGSASCIKCHGNLYNSYLHTAHYVASIPAAVNTIHGSFAKNNNVFDLSSSQKIVMEKRNNGFFQTYYLNGKIIDSRRFDIVFGGIKGESYLYWKGNGLNQLPVSYYTKQHKWLLSPRFDPRVVNFNRAITSRCLECHTSYIGDLPTKDQGLNVAEQFDKNTLIYSVDCERCHGPSAQHVNFQMDNPKVKTGKFITHFSSLPRARRIDMCAVCHSGNKSEMLRSTFGFKPGDTLGNFKLPGYVTANDNANIDVHGNQVQLLESSKCFIYSKMDCATCHDMHQNQRGNTELFIQKCMNCHSISNHNYCKIANTKNVQFIKSECLQCHMPALASNSIISTNIDKVSFANITVRTHRIAIYPKEVKRILAMFGK